MKETKIVIESLCDSSARRGIVFSSADSSIHISRTSLQIYKAL